MIPIALFKKFWVNGQQRVLKSATQQTGQAEKHEKKVSEYDQEIPKS